MTTEDELYGLMFNVDDKEMQVKAAKSASQKAHQEGTYLMEKNEFESYLKPGEHQSPTLVAPSRKKTVTLVTAPHRQGRNPAKRVVESNSRASNMTPLEALEAMSGSLRVPEKQIKTCISMERGFATRRPFTRSGFAQIPPDEHEGEIMVIKRYKKLKDHPYPCLFNWSLTYLPEDKGPIVAKVMGDGIDIDINENEKRYKIKYDDIQ
jgi:hypothetical protein